MNSIETLTLLNSELHNKNSRFSRGSLETEAKNKGLKFYTNPDFIFLFSDDVATISLDNDDQFRTTITDLDNEVLRKSNELAGWHQDPTQLWKELHTLDLVAARMLTAISEERNLSRNLFIEIHSNLEALTEFNDSKAPQDLDGFDEVVRKRLEMLDCVAINSRVALNNRRKRFPRLRRMLTKISNRD